MDEIIERRRWRELGLPQPPLLYDSVPDGELITEVLRRSKPFAPPDDGVLFREGDAPNGIFLLRGGSAKLTVQSGDYVVMCARAEAGSLLGLPSTICEMPYSMTAKASSGAEVLRVGLEDFDGLMKSQPGMSMEVVRILAGEVRAVRQAIADLHS